MTCPDATTLAEVNALCGSNTRAALAHITTCTECLAALALCDQLASDARPVDVPAALYDRLDSAISMEAQVRSTTSATTVQWQWHTPLYATLALGLSLVLLAAIVPDTSGHPVDWPAVLLLSMLGGFVLTIVERRRAR